MQKNVGILYPPLSLLCVSYFMLQFSLVLTKCMIFHEFLWTNHFFTPCPQNGISVESAPDPLSNTKYVAFVEFRFKIKVLK